MKEKSFKNGILSMLAACFFFSVMGLCVKALSAEMGFMQIAFSRSLLGLCFTLPLLWGIQLPQRQRHPRSLLWLMLRTITGVGGIACSFYAISHIPLSTAYVVGYTYPIFVAIYAAIFLGERFGMPLIYSIGLSFIGMLCIVRPAASHELLPMGIALLGGIFAALAHITVSRMRRELPSAYIVAGFAILCTLVFLPFFLRHPQLPQTPKSWGLLLLMGLTGSVAQMLMTHSFRYDLASRIGAVSYFTVLFSAVWDMLIWHHRPTPLTAIGGVLILGGGWILGRSKVKSEIPI